MSAPKQYLPTKKEIIMTITENRTFPIAPDTHEDRSATLAARILRAGGPLTGSEARPVTVHTLPGFTSNNDATITGNLIRVDRMDPHLTFLVRSTNNVSFWAYEVEPVATGTEAVEAALYADLIDSPSFAVGDLVEYVTEMTFAPVGTRGRVTQISGGQYHTEVALTLTSGDHSGQCKVTPVSALRKVEPEPVEPGPIDWSTVTPGTPAVTTRAVGWAAAGEAVTFKCENGTEECIVGHAGGERSVRRDSIALAESESEPVEADVTADDGVQRINQLTAQVAELQRVNDNQRALVAREVQRMVDFKMRVAEKMADLAEEHEWCGVAREGLEDLGMEWPDRSKTYEVTVRFTVTAEASNHRPSIDFVRQSLSINTNEDSSADNGESLSIELDSDWSNVSMSSVRIVDIDRVEG